MEEIKKEEQFEEVKDEETVENKKKPSKGLIITIVIILLLAIGAGIYIFSKYSNYDGDIVLVKTINECMEKANAENGKSSSVEDALIEARSYGFIIDRIELEGEGREIVWDPNTDRFLILNGDELVYAEDMKMTINKNLLWKFASVVPAESDYLVYQHTANCIEEIVSKDALGNDTTTTEEHLFHNYKIVNAGSYRIYTCEYCGNTYKIH